MKKLFKFLAAVFMGFALTSCSITIRSSLNKVELNKEAITLEVGQTTTLTATIKPEELASETTIVWSSLDEKVASVNDKGLVTALKEGTTKIKVTAIRGAVKREDTCTVKVVPSYIPVSGVTLDKQSGSLKVGESLTLVPTVLPNDATNKEIVWASSNESVAAVVDGIVTAISYGTATITVTTVSESKSASFELSVYQTVTGVTLDKVANTINVGESFTLKATVNPEIAQNKEVTWSTSNPHVASVNNGLVTAISSGSALITVTTKDGNHKAVCYVTVVKPVTGVTLDSTSLDLIVNEETTLVATVSPSDATNKEVVWASSNSSIVKVDDGKVKALAPGNAVISVITLDGQMKATCNITVTQPVAGVSLNKEEVTIKVDEELTLLATVSPSNATNKDVTWASSNENVASVNNGLVTAHKAGTVTITVSTIDESYEDICIIHVIQSVESVSLDKQSHSLNINDSFKLEASVLPNDATNKEVIWSSSNPYVASVNNGVVTALKAGTTTITVTTVDGNKTSSCVVTVVTPVAGVTLNKQAHTLKINETVTLSATVSPSDATNKEVIWSSSNGSVAIVDNGLIKAVGKGQAVITVTTVDGSFEANCIITVLQPVTGVTLDKEEVTIKVGDITVLHEEVLPSDATNKEVIWSSSNENVVTIKNGAVTALSKGEATVTVTTVDGSFKDTCKVTVLQPVEGVSLNKHTHTLNVNETVTLLATVSPSNATNKDVVWSSSNESVATVDNGIVKALSKGTATISVTTVDGSYKDTCVITVLQQVTGVTLSKEEISIKVGDEKVLVATVLPTNASNKDVIWSSSDEDVVTVVDGVVVTHNPGEAIVTVTTVDGGFSATCTINVVKNAVHATSVKVTQEEGINSIKVDDTLKLTATVLPANTTDSIAWYSTDENIATVDRTGLVTAHNEGSVTIVVSAGTVMSSYAITVSKITPTITLDDQEVTYLDEYEFTPTSDCNEFIEVTYYTSINGEKGVKLDSKPLNAGEYIVVATIQETYKYNSVSKEVKLVINKRQLDMSNVAWSYEEEFVYNTQERKVALVNLPDEVKADYENNVKTIVGDYKATFTLVYDEDNYELINNEITSLDWSIVKATIDLDDAAWNYSEPFTYNASEYEVKLVDVNPLVSVTYDVNKATNAGSYTTVATLTYDEHNYKLANVPALTLDWEIRKAIVTRPDADNRVFTYNGSIQTYVLATNPGIYTISGDELTQTNAGTYTIIVSLDDKANYIWDNATDEDIILTYKIAKKEVNKPTVVGTYTYNTNEQTLVLNGYNEDIMNISGNKETNAGDYTAVVTLDDNHKWANGLDGNIAWSIKRANSIITSTLEASKVYDGEILDLEDILAKLSLNHNEKQLSVVTSSTIKNVGTYTITVSVLESTNYLAATETYSFVVNPKEITVKVNNIETTYGTEKELTYTIVNGSIASNDLEKEVFELYREAGNNVGTYDIDVRTLNSNYVITSNVGKYTINKKTIEGITFTGSRVKYDGNEHSIKIDGELPEGVKDTYSPTNKYTEKGVYEITATIVDTTGNYNVPAPLTATLEIYVVVTNVTLDKNSVDLKVDETTTLTATVVPGNANIQDVTWSTSDANVATVVDGVVTAHSSGSATITVTTVDGDYTAQCVVTVTRVDNVITASKIEKTYKEDYEVVYSAANTADATITYYPVINKETGELGEGTTTKPVDAGTYKVVISIPENNKYNESKLEIDLLIKQLAVKEPILVDKTYTYNGEEQEVEFVDEIPDYMTVTGNKAINAGDHDILIELDPNYKWDGQDGKISWHINKATYDTSTFGLVVPENKVIYDGNEHVVYFNSLPEGVTATILYHTDSSRTEEFLLDGNPVNVGKYFYIITYSVDKNHTAISTDKKGDFIIEPKSVSVTWDGNEEVVYDGQNHQLVASVGESSFVEGDDVRFVFNTPNNQVKDADTYNYSVSLEGEDKDNYVIADEDLERTLVISKLEVEITWDGSSEVTYDLNNHAYSYSSSTTLVAGEDVRINFSGETTAIRVGTYNYSVSLDGSAAYNYFIKDEDLSRTLIIRAPITINKNLEVSEIVTGEYILVFEYNSVVYYIPNNVSLEDDKIKSFEKYTDLDLSTAKWTITKNDDVYYISNGNKYLIGKANDTDLVFSDSTEQGWTIEHNEENYYLKSTIDVEASKILSYNTNSNGQCVGNYKSTNNYPIVKLYKVLEPIDLTINEEDKDNIEYTSSTGVLTGLYAGVDSVTLTITPDEGYIVSSVKLGNNTLDFVEIGDTKVYTCDIDLTESGEIDVIFEQLQSYVIDRFITNNKHADKGEIKNLPETAYNGTTITFEVKLENEEYYVRKVTLDGVEESITVNGDGTYTFDVTKDHRIEVTISKLPTLGEPKTENVTIDFTSDNQRTEYTTSKQVWENEGIVLTNNKAGSTTNVGDYTNPARFYKGSELVVTAPGKISKIIFVGADESKYKTPIETSLEASGYIVTVVGDNYIVSFDEAVEEIKINSFSAQARMSSIIVTYTAVTLTYAKYSVTSDNENIIITDLNGKDLLGKYEEGSEVSFKVTPNGDYHISKVEVQHGTNEKEELTQDNGHYSFTVGENDVEIIVTTIEKYSVTFYVDEKVTLVVKDSQGKEIKSGDKVLSEEEISYEIISVANGYELDKVFINGVESESNTIKVTSNTTIEVTSKAKSFDISKEVLELVDGNEVDASDKAVIDNLEESGLYNSTITFTVDVTNSSYEIRSVLVNDSTIGVTLEGSTYKFTLTGETTVKVVVGEKTVIKYNVNVNSFENGEVSELKSQYAAGEQVSFVVNPVNDDDYYVRDVKVNNGDIELSKSGNRYSFTMPEGNVDITISIIKKAVITINNSEHTTISVNNGTLGTGSKVELGTVITYKVSVSDGYEITGVTVNDETASISGTIKVEGNITIKSTESPISYTITEEVIDESEAPDADEKVEIKYLSEGTKYNTQILFSVEVIDTYEVKGVYINNSKVPLSAEEGKYSFTIRGNTTITVVIGLKTVEETLSISIKDYASTNSWGNGTKYTTVDLENKVTITASGGGNTGKYYTSGNEWRIYQTESPTVEVQALDGYTIKTVKITYNVSNTGVLTFGGSKITSGTVVDVNAESISFGVGNSGTATNGQVKITAIEVVLISSGGSSSEPETPEYNVTYSTGDYVLSGLNANGKYAVGTVVEFTVTANDGYNIDKVSLDDFTVALTNSNNNYSFTMPGKDVKITVTTKVAASKAWTLVTDASTLKVGDQIVIVAKDYDYALSKTQNDNNRGQAAVTKNTNTITFGTDVQVITLEAGTTSGTFAFYTGDAGYLYAAASNKNYLRSQSTINANASWKITISSGTATIKAQGSNTRNVMQYNLNNGSPLFACYGSASQKAVCIYKYE